MYNLLRSISLLLERKSFRGSALPSKVLDLGSSIGQNHGTQNWWITSHHWIHSSNALLEGEKDQQSQIHTEGGSVAVEGTVAKVKRKKLKGKRAVVRGLKFFRFKKKNDYKRMTDEEKILYKLNKLATIGLAADNYPFGVVLGGIMEEEFPSSAYNFSNHKSGLSGISEVPSSYTCQPWIPITTVGSIIPRLYQLSATG